MGHQGHHAIVVTGLTADRVILARTKAAKIFGDQAVTGLAESRINGIFSFLVGPDGSRKGKVEAERGDRQRDECIAWLDSARDESGAFPYEWGDFGDQAVTGLAESRTNGIRSSLVGPDGSRKGEVEAEIGARHRDEFIAWLDSTRDEKGASPYAWVEVQYGGGEGVTSATRHSDEEARRRHRDWKP